MTQRIRRTKVVATLGPSCRAPGMVDKLVKAGVDVFRVNLSHATLGELDEWIAVVRAAATAQGRTIGVLADLQGPKLRLGRLRDHAPLTLQAGAPVEITTQDVEGTSARLSTRYSALPHDVKKGDRILLADGAVELRVEAVEGDSVRCIVVNGGTIKEHAGMNLPGVAVSSPALTEKDRVDLDHAVKAGADFIALSFVRDPADVRETKAAIAAAGGDAPVIAKIERPEAIEELDQIIDESDAVMVARGDLGVEMLAERVPMLQKLIIKRAGALLKPVITATQMLESMVHAPRPTRAEASDVANAIIDGTDAIMLSEETSAGEYPLESVETMVRIALETEEFFPPRVRRSVRVDSDSHAISHAACSITESIDVRCIAAFTQSGFSARIVSKDRPKVPIYAYAPNEVITRRLALDWGVIPCLVTFGGSTDELIASVEADLLARRAVTPGEAVVVVGGTPMGVRGRTNFLKIVRPSAPS
ncbi:MAG: pyruvate kinase [Candidatus Eremiobacteraeota bacterium]|nr:pyruvate kinase [Candidatus Eremiobacteraeota bacterium]MBV8365572.1 pyruvate kinase [Candidatus Eremiobacteraeota bacterium]